MPHVNLIIFDPDDEDEGYFAFDDILGMLQPKLKQVETIVRPGIDGETLRNTAVRAEPSQIITVRGVVNRGAGLDFLDAYRELIDGLPYELVQHSESLGFVRVIHVNALPFEPIASAAGWLEAYPAIVQRVAWTVISTVAPE